MTAEKKINQTVLRVIRDDITMLSVEGFVFYAQPDLQLGSGFGNAIAIRGGPAIQEELKKLGPQEVGAVVITGAGDLKARHILHAVGPRFQEENLESKLRATAENILARADENGLENIALPAIGAGFYGIPLDTCARVALETVKKYVQGSTKLKEVIFCLRDSKEFTTFKSALEALA